MGLRDLIIPTERVEVADSYFTVRGLSPNDALGLYYRHRGQLSAMFEQFSARAKAEVAVDVTEFGASLVGGAPQIMAEIIALASNSDPRGEDWDGDVGVALTLSAGVQMDALEKIGRLTFTSEMPPKKFFGLVLAMAQSATAAMSAPKT